MSSNKPPGTYSQLSVIMDTLKKAHADADAVMIIFGHVQLLYRQGRQLYGWNVEMHVLNSELGYLLLV